MHKAPWTHGARQPRSERKATSAQPQPDEHVALNDALAKLAKLDSEQGRLAMALVGTLQQPATGPDQPLTVSMAQASAKIAHIKQQFDKSVNSVVRLRGELAKAEEKANSLGLDLEEAEDEEKQLYNARHKHLYHENMDPKPVIDFARLVREGSDLGISDFNFGNVFAGADGLEDTDKLKLEAIKSDLAKKFTEAAKGSILPIIEQLKGHFDKAEADATQFLKKRKVCQENASPTATGTDNGNCSKAQPDAAPEATASSVASKMAKTESPEGPDEDKLAKAKEIDLARKTLAAEITAQAKVKRASAKKPKGSP